MHRSTTILFLQDLRKSYPDRWVSQLLDHVLREHAVLDLIDGVAGLVGQSLEAHPDQDGATDVVSPDARPAALAGLDSGELLFFAVRTYARAMLTDGVLNCSIMYCESMPCLI